MLETVILLLKTKAITIGKVHESRALSAASQQLATLRIITSFSITNALAS